MSAEAVFVVGQPTRCSGVYVMHWEVTRFVIRVPRRWFGSRSLRCELVPAVGGQPRNPLEFLGEPLPQDWRHHPALRFNVTVDVTPLEQGRFGHLGWLRWRLRVDDWVSVTR
jgi:hypothetical protein